MILVWAAPLLASGVAAVWDWRTGLIPYAISGTTAGAAALLMMAGGLPWTHLLWGIGTWAALEGATAWHWDHFGAGDTTLFGALACWLGPFILPLIALTALVNLGRAGMQWAGGQGWPSVLRLGPSIAVATLTLTTVAWWLAHAG